MMLSFSSAICRVNLVCMVWALGFTSLVAAAERGFENSLQFAVEYDDNVFKSFGSSREDALFKTIVKSQNHIYQEGQRFDMAFQVGGKKYFRIYQQDTAIGQLDLSSAWQLNDKIQFELSNILKGQLENGEKDDANIDINENFISNSTRLLFYFPFLWQWQQQLGARINYFTFFGDLPIDYVEEQLTSHWSRALAGKYIWRLGYELHGLQFSNSSPGRYDLQQEFSTAVQYQSNYLLSLGYAYLDTYSSEAFFTSSSHRINALFSMLLPAKMTLHALASLQIRRYPAVSQVTATEEGQRLLFSDSEDNNFNTLTIKLTHNLTTAWTAELKYARYSNEFSDREEDFARNLWMLGLRAVF